MSDQTLRTVAYCAVIYSRELIGAIGDGDKVAGLSHAVFPLQLPEMEARRDVPEDELPAPQMAGLTVLRHDGHIHLRFNGTRAAQMQLLTVSVGRPIAARMGPTEMIISIHLSQGDAEDWRDDTLQAIADGDNAVCSAIDGIRI